MVDFDPDLRLVTIPDNATLKDIITMMNAFKLKVNVKDPNNKAWLYKYRSWVEERPTDNDGGLFKA